MAYFLAAILIFGVLIAVHEFGHFAAAKLSGVKVNEFSIGMGPEIWSRQKGETQYSLRLLPIGGFCAMEGEDEDTGDARCMVNQGFWKQFFILAAGPFMNFVAGLLILLILYAGAVTFFTDEILYVSPEVQQQGEEGFLPGDQIYKVNGYRCYVAGDASLCLSFAKDGETEMELIRDGRHIKVEHLARQSCTDQAGKSYHGFGIMIGLRPQEATLGAKLRFTWNTALDFVQQVRFSLVQLFTGGASMKDLSGPVGIVSTITEVGSEAESSYDAWTRIFYFAALIAVNLAVMNLLPIPALDGGRIFFLLVDAVSLLLFKRKVPQKYQAAVNTAGFVLLMGFMLFVTFQDVFKLFR